MQTSSSLTGNFSLGMQRADGAGSAAGAVEFLLRI